MVSFSILGSSCAAAPPRLASLARLRTRRIEAHSYPGGAVPLPPKSPQQETRGAGERARSLGERPQGHAVLGGWDAVRKRRGGDPCARDVRATRWVLVLARWDGVPAGPSRETGRRDAEPLRPLAVLSHGHAVLGGRVAVPLRPGCGDGRSGRAPRARALRPRRLGRRPRVPGRRAWQSISDVGRPSRDPKRLSRAPRRPPRDPETVASRSQAAASRSQTVASRVRSTTWRSRTVISRSPSPGTTSDHDRTATPRACLLLGGFRGERHRSPRVGVGLYAAAAEPSGRSESRRSSRTGPPWYRERERASARPRTTARSLRTCSGSARRRLRRRRT